MLLIVLISCKKEGAAETVSPGNTTNVVPQYPGQITIAQLSPATVSQGTIVTLSGTNFGTNASLLTVLFNGKIAPIQSVTATELKVKVPLTTSGAVAIITSSALTFSGPSFTYVSSPAFIEPYLGGDIYLNSQADVDAFATVNQGKQLKITGNLNIGPTIFAGNEIISLSGLSNITSVSGNVSINNLKLLTEAPFLNTMTAAGGISIMNSGLVKLSFNNLKSFSGNLIMSLLSNLTDVSFNGLTLVNNLYIASCPLLKDLSFLSNVTSAGSIYLYALGATAITMDHLTKITQDNLAILVPTNLTIAVPGGLTIGSFANVNHISFKSLTAVSGRLYISLSQQLSHLNFDSLISISDKLTLAGTNLADMSDFRALQYLGALSLTANPVLMNLHGLEHLATLNSPAIDPRSSSSSPAIRFGGNYLENNAKLNSLSGLQSITTVPIVYISGNPMLNDLCPLKILINMLSTAPDYSYRIPSTQVYDVYVSTSTPALTLTKNNTYTTTQDALAAVALCK